MGRDVRRWVVVGALLLSVTGVAHAEPRPYRGPLPLDLDGHWDMNRSVHVHDDLAVGLAPFADIDGVLTFLGDPLAYGYTGDVWTYEGVHPLPAWMGGGYCGIRGPHRHAFAPEGGPYRETDDGAYVFNGAMHGGVPVYRPDRLAPVEPRPPAPAAAPTWLAAPWSPFAPVCVVYVTDRRGRRTLRYTSWGCSPVVDARRRDHDRDRRGSRWARDRDRDRDDGARHGAPPPSAARRRPRPPPPPRPAAMPARPAQQGHPRHR